MLHGPGGFGGPHMGFGGPHMHIGGPGMMMGPHHIGIGMVVPPPRAVIVGDPFYGPPPPHPIYGYGYGRPYYDEEVVCCCEIF